MKYSLWNGLMGKRLRTWRLWFFGAIGIGMIWGTVSGACLALFRSGLPWLLSGRPVSYDDAYLLLLLGPLCGVLIAVLFWWILCPSPPKPLDAS